ncbi:MAG: hypothetical protein EA406_09850 [Rhodospirillales bacterium]|nr:MAG: hypothetical protein EA406_09850 [Rhodospirillales bacterium]
MFTAELWQFFALVVVPLIGVIFGGIVYWLRKLDDRQYYAAMNGVNKSDLAEALRPLNERLIRIENRIETGAPPSAPVSRWRNP